MESPNLRGQRMWSQRFQPPRLEVLESPRTEVSGSGVPEPQRSEDVEPEVPAYEDGGLEFIEYELGTSNIPHII